MPAVEAVLRPADNPAVRLLRSKDVPVTERDRVFCYSRGKAIALVVLLAGTAAGLLWLGLVRHAALAFYLLGVVALGALLMKRFVLARFRSSNWLVRIGDASLYVQFRSHLNYHFPPDDPTVVSLGLGEIRSARLVRVRRVTPDLGERRPAAVTEVGVRVVELEIEPDAALAAALAAESARRAPREGRWYGSSAIRYGHYPVQLESPGRLRIEWKASPGPGALFEALRPYTRIDPPIEETKDFTKLGGASREEQDRRLAELARSGRTIEAVAIARGLYGEDLTRAKQRVDRLRGAEEGERRAS